MSGSCPINPFSSPCQGKAIHSMVAHLDAVTCLAVDPNGVFLMSGSKCLSAPPCPPAACILPAFGFESHLPGGGWAVIRVFKSSGDQKLFPPAWPQSEMSLLDLSSFRAGHLPSPLAWLDLPSGLRQRG